MNRDVLAALMFMVRIVIQAAFETITGRKRRFE